MTCEHELNGLLPSANPSELSPRPWQMTTRADWSASLAGLTVMVPSPDRSMRGAIFLYEYEEEDGE